jgi:hypothetical protein
MIRLRLMLSGLLHTPQSRLRSIAALSLCYSMIGCAAPQPPRITFNGALPSGNTATFVLADGGVDGVWLSSAAVERCLQDRGMQPASSPQYYVQYALAVRPEISGLLVGKQSEGAQPAVKAGHKSKGERIITKLLVDRISDGQRVYEVSIDAAYKARQSTADGRAAQLCAAIGGKAG